jgi:hypothetical protein
MGGLRRLLGPDERVLWSGEPRRGLALRPEDAYGIPFGIFWCGFLAFWLCQPIKTGRTDFSLWGLGILSFGFYFMFIDHFLVDAYRRAHTLYAVTTDRVIIISTVFSDKIVSLAFNQLAPVEIRLKSNGEATIKFGPEETGRRARKVVRPAFEFIPNGQNVYNLIMGQVRTTLTNRPAARDVLSYPEI